MIFLTLLLLTLTVAFALPAKGNNHENGYYGLIPKHPSKPNTTLRSTDERFTVKHGEAGANQTLILKYLDQTFTFKEYAEMTVRLKLNTVVQIEYDYWVCI
ncbi:hypothetical protein K457DRAFT_125251 [Linnemannia elongata AG-77]|uniref:Uncharacterized protein n=1 Tax=Linnemannia elongata AG-77 TaxID=1314771 RepID=A0A197JXL4_9FUNG|nr:hypothetical protein K457DRAFT_125251 [Linnemannia elongata AG-77]